MKKLAGLLVFIGVTFALTMAGQAYSGLSFEYDEKTYTLEQVSLPESGFPFDVQQKDGVLEFTDKTTGLEASLTINSLDKTSFDALRKYYNNDDLTSDELYAKYLGLQESYIPALQDVYRNSFLYGSAETPYTESNMKIFFQGTEDVFGRPADVFLYNILKAERGNYLEETHLGLIIPISIDYAVANLDISFKTGQFNDGMKDAVTLLLNSLRFNGLPKQTDALKLFGQEDVIEAANKGIYPTPGDKDVPLTDLKDSQAGFALKYPSSYWAYMQNALGGKLASESFKINPDNIFSVSAEQTRDADAIDDRIDYIYSDSNTKINDKHKETVTINGEEYVYLTYELENADGVVTYIQDYFTLRNDMIYDLSLSSRFTRPSSGLNDEFARIVESFTTTAPENKAPDENTRFITYANKEEGYSFDYPDNWKLTGLSSDINYDSLSLKMPELSGQMEVYFSEGELNPGIASYDIPACLSGVDTVSFDRYIKKYTPPYTGAVKKLLYFSSKIEDGIIYVYKLINYVDPNGRTRLSYSIDIVNKGKIYSMFISVSEYASLEGRIANPELDSLVNSIAASFKYEETPESKERLASGETRNRKVVELEKIVQKLLGSDARITQAVNAGSGGSYYITVENYRNSGYYRVKPDFNAGTAIIEQKVLREDIIGTELNKIYNELKYEKIVSYSVYEDTMYLEVNSRNSTDSDYISRTYRINVEVSPNGILWETIYMNHPRILKKELKAFLEAYLSASVEITYLSPDEFKDIENYRKGNSNYTTMVYAEFDGRSGFFILEINPRDDDIKLLSYKSSDTLYEEIASGIEQNDNRTIMYDFFDKNNFTMNFEIRESGKAETVESYHVKLNPETLMLDYAKTKAQP